MSTEHSSPMTSPIVLHFGRTLRRMSDAEFFRFCRRNGDWRIERTAQGDLVIMPPTGGGSGSCNFDLTGQFWSWCSQNGTGIGFDSSTGFRPGQEPETLDRPATVSGDPVLPGFVLNLATLWP